MLKGQLIAQQGIDIYVCKGCKVAATQNYGTTKQSLVISA